MFLRPRGLCCNSSWVVARVLEYTLAGLRAQLKVDLWPAKSDLVQPHAKCKEGTTPRATWTFSGLLDLLESLIYELYFLKAPEVSTFNRKAIVPRAGIIIIVKKSNKFFENAGKNSAICRFELRVYEWQAKSFFFVQTIELINAVLSCTRTARI